jgi:hypothetical protein
MQPVFCEVCPRYTVDPISVKCALSFVTCRLVQKNWKLYSLCYKRECQRSLGETVKQTVLFQVRTLFVSGLPMDAKPRELYLLFRAYEVSKQRWLGPVHSVALAWRGP